MINSIQPLNSRIADAYHEDELLTAEEFNKVPAKINEIIWKHNQEVIPEIASLSTNVTQLNQIVTGSGEINAHVELADRSVNEITQNVELRLRYDDDDRLYIEKIIPFVPKISALSATSFVIDSVPQSTGFEITRQQGTDVIDTSTIVVHTTAGELSGSGRNWTLYTSQNASVYAEVNGVNTNTVNITFNKKEAGTFWSPELITARELQPSNHNGFVINPLTSIRGIKKFDSGQKPFTAHHPDGTTMYYMYFIIVCDYTTATDIRQHMFINNSSLGGGVVYVGQVTQYSTEVTYSVYRTTLKYDEDITIDIK